MSFTPSRREDAGAAPARVDALRQALAHLREGRSVAQLNQRATAEACRTLGFDRAALFSVRGGALALESLHVDGDGRGALDAVADVPPGRPGVGHPLAEVVRRRAPMLVSREEAAAQEDGPPLGEAAPYVAAPIMPAGRVIAILCADRGTGVRALDARDRDALWAFAEGLGYALERAVLLERLRAQRSKVQELIGAAAAAIDDLNGGELDLAADPAKPLSTGDGPISIDSESGIEELMTKRELEVLSLLAAGVSNAGIATRLVISEYTVKTHVKSILRKLRAENRAEAVSRYLLALRSGRRRVVGRRREDYPHGVEPVADA
jgi:DNA-binding CsgD family transcriptional regulator